MGRLTLPACLHPHPFSSVDCPALLPSSHVGKLEGRFYDEQGKAKDVVGEFDELLKRLSGQGGGEEVPRVRKVGKKYPGCARWGRSTPGAQGGEEVPRVRKVGKKYPGCARWGRSTPGAQGGEEVPRVRKVGKKYPGCARWGRSTPGAQGGEEVPRVQPVMGAERGRQGSVSPSLLFSKSSLRCASLPTSHSPLMVLRSCLVPHCSRLVHTSLFLPPRCSFLLPAPLSGSTSAASHKADAVETRYPGCIL
ncbi:unnamed protein product [Closterium sp. NIES-64]|nr:unnamed protein product [Closterium sp. NIES-64]